jgi:rhomboid protease GluP
MISEQSRPRRTRQPELPPEMANFIEVLRQRKAVVVMAILVINVLVYLAMSVPGLNLDLLRLGSKNNSAIANGEYWRLLTCIFLHVGFAHLAFNSLALYAFGRDLEKIYGAGRFILIYLGAGVLGSLASYVFSPKDSVGASGAIFGLVGLALVFGFRYRRVIPPQFKSRFGTGVLPVLLYNIIFGLGSASRIDNFAHLGGLAGGILFGLAIPAGFDSLDEPI